MIVGLITYDFPHLKTEQVFDALLRRGYRLRVFGLPFVPRKARSVQFQHRPDQARASHPAEICKRHGVTYRRCESDSDIDGQCDVYHVLVGKILSPECLRDRKIMNCHPGIIPAVRGLDAFKWAILNDQPLGVTLHYIDEAVDAGEILAVLPTSVYPDDSLESLARRHYELEIDVIIDFERYLAEPRNAFARVAPGDARLRMPGKLEATLLRAADEYIARFAGAPNNSHGAEVRTIEQGH